MPKGTHCNVHEVVEEVEEIREGIIQFADANSINVIILGTRGHGLVKR